MLRMYLGSAIILFSMLPSGVSARRLPDSGTPQSMQRLIACRSVADSTARLACFDLESKGIAAAISSKDLVIVDRERAKVAGRSMFGFSIPNFGGLFGTGGEMNSIEQKVAGVSRNAYGGWLIKLDDGSVWSQSDDSALGLEPRAGQKVTVKRGALGSFVMSVAGQPGFKAVRVS